MRWFLETRYSKSWMRFWSEQEGLEWKQLSRIRYVMDNLLQLTAANNYFESGVDIKSLSGPDSHSIFEKSSLRYYSCNWRKYFQCSFFWRGTLIQKLKSLKYSSLIPFTLSPLSWPVPAFEHSKQEEYMKMCRKFSVVCINWTRALDFLNDKSS